MILQALCTYYDALARRGDVTPPGWSVANVSYALEIGENGALRGVIPLKQKREGSAKELPQSMQVPEQVKKTSGVASNFLCENSTYFLGIDRKGDPNRAKKCFEAAKSLHQEILASVQSPAGQAVCAFFDAWQPEQAEAHPLLQPYLDEILKGANLIFSFRETPVHNDPAVREAWEKRRAGQSADAAAGICLVTGEYGPIARLHPAIKGVRDAQPTGASLVSFNAPAFESYGHEGKETGQGLNSPVSEQAVFKYGAALNRLIADKRHIQYIGDTAVVFWAEDADPLCQDLFALALFGSPSDTVTDEDLRSVMQAISHGNPVDPDGLSGRFQNRFYVLGLAPNAARLSVRFFLQDTFGRMLANVQAHYDRLEIVKPAYVANGALPLWKLLNETVNQKSRDKKASPPMAGAVMRAILSDGNYPVSLLEQTMLRIRADRDITYGRAAILKAFFLKNREYQVPKEVLTVELNEESNYVPYVLGRLFAVLERIQQAANPGINATIKDKYFNSACATPAAIFPLLVKLSQSHLKKLDGGLRGYFEKIIGDLECRLRETLPARLSLADQGAFQQGYYHQRFYTKKDEGGNKNV